MRLLSIALAATAVLSTSAPVGAVQSASTSGQATTARPHHHNAVIRVLHGTLEKVDAAGKTIVIKTADGGETIVHFTDNTVVHGISKAGGTAALAGKEGAHVLVHYTDASAARAGRAGARAAEAAGGELRKAGEKTAREVVFIGHAAVNLAEGTVVSVDRAAKTVAVDTAKGAHELFRLGEDCTINTAHGVERAATASRRALTKGARAVFYYTEEGGQKVVHAIDEIAHAA